MARNHTSKNTRDPERGDKLGLLHEPECPTQSIDLDSLFTRDVTSSGSFDLSRLKEVSFGKLLEALPIPTLLIEPSLRIVYANEASSLIAGDCSNVVGIAFSSLFPEESERAASFVRKVLAERKTQIFEGLLKIDPRVSWCRVHLRSIRFQQQRSVLAIIEDLTAEKKQLIINEKYQRLVQIFPIGIAEFVLEEPVLVSSSAEELLAAFAEAELIGGNLEFARMSGFTSVESLKGLPLRSLFPFEEQHREKYYWWIKKGFPIRSFESRERDSERRSRYCEISFVANIKNECLVGLWGLKQDITHRKHAETGLRAARDILEERVQQKSAQLVETGQLLTVEMGERFKAEEELACLVQELQAALAKVKILSGLLPICASCKKIRNDSGYWTQVEVYVRDHSDAEFTHSICPECAAKLYPEFFPPGTVE
jgi:PAS domain S-box-containing protein